MEMSLKAPKDLDGQRFPPSVLRRSAANQCIKCSKPTANGVVRRNGRRDIQNALRRGVHLHTTHRYCNLMLEAVVPRRNTGFIPVTPNAITVAH